MNQALHTRVVALGGGHGTAVTLRAVREYASDVCAVVSVADDGGSSGRLSELLDLVALGDMRKCLVALAAPDSILAVAFERRFEEAELAGHALGNLILAGLIEASGGLVSGVQAAAELLGASGRVLPATSERVTLKADLREGQVAGQVAVSQAGRIRKLSLVPNDAPSPSQAIDAILAADQVIIGPGSLYTSVLAAASAQEISKALSTCSAQRVYVCNLHPQEPETSNYDVEAHVEALTQHGVEVDVVLCDTGGGLRMGKPSRPVVMKELRGDNGLVHDPVKLGKALRDLLP